MVTADDRLTAWRVAMADLTREHEDLVARGRWTVGPSDFLSVIRRERDELTHSRLLAWLLTPTARHRLGSAVLTRILAHCRGSAVGSPETVRDISCEYARNLRRADIIVWGEDFTLVVENKVDAEESPGQCEDLYANFKNEPGPLFLFLTPDGHPPQTATSAAARAAFTSVAWPTIRGMIEDAIEASPRRNRASALAVARDYVRTLREQFG